MKEKPREGKKKRLRPKMRKSSKKNRGESRLPVERMSRRVRRVIIRLFDILRYIWIGLLGEDFRAIRS
jgi:hypothetical protein